MALLGERIAHDALKCIATCDDASQCQQARQAIQAIDDLQERRAELLAVEKIANAKVAAEAAALWARNLETRKVAMECRLRKAIRQELREEMIRHVQAQSDDAPASTLRRKLPTFTMLLTMWPRCARRRAAVPASSNPGPLPKAA